MRCWNILCCPGCGSKKIHVVCIIGDYIQLALVVKNVKIEFGCDSCELKPVLGIRTRGKKTELSWLAFSSSSGRYESITDSDGGRVPFDIEVEEKE